MVELASASLDAWPLCAEVASVPYDDDRQQACLVTVPSPATVRQAAVVVALEGAALVGVAAVLFVRRRTRRCRPVPGSAGSAMRPGSRSWAAAVLAAGWALWTGTAVGPRRCGLRAAAPVARGLVHGGRLTPVALRDPRRGRRTDHAWLAVQPVGAAVAGGSGFGGQRRQLGARHPVGDPLGLRPPADGVV